MFVVLRRIIINKQKGVGMVKIWKIGAWPGLWGNNNTKNKEKYITEYALPYDFVAIGSAYIPDITKLSEPEKEMKTYMEDVGKKPKSIPERIKQILNFTKDIHKGDVILLYHQYKAYVGIVKNEKPYYYVEKGSEKDFIKDTIGDNIAPHRIDVEWLFDKRSFDTDFSMWQDRVHQVLREDLDKIKNEKLRRFLEQKLADSEHDELIDKVYDIISPYFQHIFIEKRNDTGEIQVFDETELIKGEQNRFKIAKADMIVLDGEEKPLLVIEPETSSSPKTFGRSIPIYTIAQKVRIRGRDYSIEFPLLLLIVIPTQQECGQKAEQLTDLEKKLKKTINWKESNLKDFAICQIGDLKPTLKRLFIDNGYDKYGYFFD